MLVAGDAGAGKTTLVTDLAQRARALGFTVAVGHCLDIEADISFAAVVEAVSSLVEGVEPGSRPLARRMQTLLDPTTPRAAEPLHLLDDLRLTVLEAALGAPVLFVLEDLHWADESTRDLATALARTARGRLLFALTVRTDDLHRRHPARRALAEIGRVTGGRRVELGPLSLESIAEMVGSITGGTPDPALVRAVMDRSEGNPLYAEEVAAAGPGSVPDQLSDLFLARLDALSDGSVELARIASVDGTRVDVETLADLAKLEREPLNAHLRELLDANVMRAVGDSIHFRHGLIREAVYDDLLPDERTRLHTDLAAILQTRVDAEPEPRLSLVSRLAYHWTAAHDLPRALAASWRAGRTATDMGMAESVVHLDRVLSLWDRVPDAEGLVGITKIEMVTLLAKASLDQGDGERWHSLTTRAVDMVGPHTDPLVASGAYCSFAFSAMFNDPGEAAEAVRLAEQYAGDAPSKRRAFALAARALLHNASNHFASGLEAADRAIIASREVEAADPLLLALMFRAGALQYLGRVGESLEAWDDAIRVARTEGRLVETLDRVHHMASRLVEFGQVALGVELAQEGQREGITEGLVVSAAWCSTTLIVARIWAGDFDGAEKLLNELADLGLVDDNWWCKKADLILARGDVDTASQVMPSTAWDLVSAVPPPEETHDMRMLRIFRTAVLRGDDTACLETAAAYLALAEDSDSPLHKACAARLGFQTLTVVRTATDPRVPQIREEAARRLREARADPTHEWRTTYHGVQLALAEGYAAKVEGRSAIAEFRKARELAEPFGAFFALEPRLELAEQLLAHDGRNEGRELLVDCWSVARDMGAGAHERRAARLATRTRVPLPESAVSEGAVSRLTPREREVLSQLATGATNKAIADELVISEKTVSVHVSNVLAKLGAENRGEAAALARDLLG